MSIIPIFAIGAAVGSFLNVVADRIPAGGSVVGLTAEFVVMAAGASLLC